MTRILLVEDEASYRDPLSYQLGREGYEVVAVVDGHSAVDTFDDTIDLVLSGLVLSGLSGIEVCRVPRTTSAVPIIMVGAKDEEIDNVVGRELGADDYLTKPYSFRELLARIRAVLRRGQKVVVCEPDRAGEVLTARRISMDLEGHLVTVAGREVAMLLREFESLELLGNPDLVLTRGQLIDRVWEPTTSATRNPSTSTSNGCGSRSRVMRAILALWSPRGVGYKLVPNPD